MLYNTFIIPILRLIIKIMSLENRPELDRIEEAVSMEDGIFQINDNLYNSNKAPKDEKLQDLIESVSSETDEDEDEEDDGFVNFLDILNIDLPLNNKGSENSDKVIGQKTSIFSESGFNYDSFRSSFKVSNIGVIQSLMRVSQQFDAVFAGLLVLDGGNWKMDHSLGFNPKTMDKFVFSENEEFCKEIFANKKILLYENGKYSIDEIDSKIIDGDLAFMNGGFFLPIIFNQKSAYLFLGLKTVKSIKEYIDYLQKL